MSVIMQVSDIMITPPGFCTPDMPLRRVIGMLLEYGCGALPVVEHEGSREPIGIVTGLAITERMVAETRPPGPMDAVDVMAGPLKVAPETSLGEVRACLDGTLVRHLLVVDEEGDCVGMVSRKELRQYASSRM